MLASPSGCLDHLCGKMVTKLFLMVEIYSVEETEIFHNSGALLLENYVKMLIFPSRTEKKKKLFPIISIMTEETRERTFPFIKKSSRRCEIDKPNTKMNKRIYLSYTERDLNLN